MVDCKHVSWDSLKNTFQGFQISDHTKKRKKHNGGESSLINLHKEAIETDAFDLRARMMSF